MNAALDSWISCTKTDVRANTIPQYHQHKSIQIEPALSSFHSCEAKNDEVRGRCQRGTQWACERVVVDIWAHVVTLYSQGWKDEKHLMFFCGLYFLNLSHLHLWPLNKRWSFDISTAPAQQNVILPRMINVLCLLTFR